MWGYNLFLWSGLRTAPVHMSFLDQKTEFFELLDSLLYCITDTIQAILLHPPTRNCLSRILYFSPREIGTLLCILNLPLNPGLAMQE